LYTYSWRANFEPVQAVMELIKGGWWHGSPDFLFWHLDFIYIYIPPSTLKIEFLVYAVIYKMIKKRINGRPGHYSLCIKPKRLLRTLIVLPSC